jgi:hypothetical protein
VKILAHQDSFAQEDLIPVFHKWIREDRLADTILDTILIDVADYRHVPHGPGVMLVAHEAHYGLDEGGGEIGLLYARKRDPIGAAADKLREALTACLQAASALQGEPTIAGRLSFNPGALEIRVMSRLVARNTAADANQLRPIVEQVLGPLLGVDDLQVEQAGDARQPLTLRASTAQTLDLATVVGRL